MEIQLPEDLTFSEVGHLPIIKDFAKKIKLVETLDAMVESQMELSPGITVLATVLDTLSGRTPPYRLEEFFHSMFKFFGNELSRSKKVLGQANYSHTQHLT